MRVAIGIVVLCCDDVTGLQAAVETLSVPVVFSCETVEMFGGDKTAFAILCKGSVDVALLRRAFEELSGE